MWFCGEHPTEIYIIKNIHSVSTSFMPHILIWLICWFTYSFIQQLYIWQFGFSGNPKITTDHRRCFYRHCNLVTETKHTHNVTNLVSSVAPLCPTLCNPMDWSTPVFPVHHKLPQLAQTHVHWVSDATQPSHPLPTPSPPIFSVSQHQGLFKRVSSSHQVAEELEFQLQLQSFQWIFRTDFL